jgi:WD40 repeat protein/serine/threonine protein kinase
VETVKTIKGYELHERIGSGGFGVVHRATQTTVGREVAIKIILPHFANQPDFIRRFETEAQLIARLEHPFIVPLYDYWRDPAGAYLVMRWLRGGSLRDALAQGPFGLEDAVLFMDQVTSALALAHRNGVVHRDLKPANILLDEDGYAYLSDFGIAKDMLNATGNQTGIDVILGSPDYLSPEQARSEPVLPQTDIYSLGVVLYEVLTGQHPFPNLNSVERMYKHLNEPLPFIETLPSEVAEGINTIIQRATAKNPAQRYADVLEMAADFRRETDLGQRAGENIVEQLTLREQEILQMIIDGCTNKDIAQRLFITVGTVKWHVRQVYQKLHVRSRVQAMSRARELNLLVADTAAEPIPTESTYIALPEPGNPYKGLRAFQMADARDFFGRERLIQRLVNRLGEHDKLARFLAVVGPSGSGKSSVVKAGLVPALWRGDLPGSERWFVVEMIPGAHPLDELEIALTRVAANQAGNLREHLERDSRGLVRVAGLILPDDGSELLVIVDQFEEVFTLVEDETIRTRFLDLLCTAVTDPRSRVRIVVTLRADFYDRPLHYPDFGELVRSRMETVLPLSAEELEAAIAKPAARVGVSFEPGLVATITGDVHYQPGALPLLQYALTELFEQRADRTLTHEAYQALGGAAGALAKRAEELVQEQDETGQEIVRQMFLRLVTLGEGVEDTRRRVPRSELLGVAGDEDRMDEAVDTYAAYRLLTLDHDPVTRGPTVEIAHEAILHEWERLRAWLNESRADIRQQRLLAAAAAEWLQSGEDSSYLLRGARLEQFAGWAADTQLALTLKERDFLDTCIAEHQRQETAEQERQQRELETQRQLAEQRRRSANRLRTLVAALTVFLVAAVMLVIFAFDRESKAQDARAKAEREAAVNRSLVLADDAVEKFEAGDPDTGLRLALEAVSIDQPPAEAIRSLSTIAFEIGTRAVLRDQGNAIKAVAFSPDAKYGLSGGCSELVDNQCTQGELILWDLQAATELRHLEGHTGWINSVEFSPNPEMTPPTALTASSDGTLILWNVETGEIIRRYEGHTGSVNSAAFSPDGQSALSGADDSTLILWDVPTGEVLRRFGPDNPDTPEVEGHTGAVTTVAFSRDGATALSGSADKTIIQWNVATGEIIHRFEGHEDGITDVAFRPDPSGNETLMLSVAFDSTLREWNLETGEISRTMKLTVFAPNISVFLDGRTAFAPMSFGPRLFDLENWELARHIMARSTTLVVALSADDRLALEGDEDGTLRLLNMPVSAEIRRFEDEGGLLSVDVGPDGHLLATGSLTGGRITVWDVQTGQPLRRFDGLEDTVGLVRFSPDGRYILAGSWDVSGLPNRYTLLDAETGQIVHELEDHQFLARALAFSPDGRTMLTGSLQYGSAWKEQGAGELILWDTQTGQMVRRFDTAEDIMSLDYSADGRRALTASIFHRNVTLWDLETGEVLRRYDYTSRTGQPFQVIWAPGETSIIVSMGNDGSLQLIDLETGNVLRRFIGLDSPPYSIDISPDGRYLISTDAWGMIILWDFKTGQELRRFPGHTAYVFRVMFSPDGQTAYSSSGDGTVREWQIAEWSLEELLGWVQDNRYIREFTCEERAQYRVEPLCE